MLPTQFRLSLLKLFAAILIFGTVPASISSVSADAFSLGLLRLCAATLAFSVILLASGKFRELRRLSGKEWQTLLLIGFLFGLHWLTYILSIKKGGPAIGAIGFTTYGVQIPLLGWLFGFGRPSLRTFLAFALAISGASLCLIENNKERPQIESAVAETDAAIPPETSSTASGGLAVWLVVALLSGTFYAGLPLLHQRNAHLSNSVRTWAQFTFALPVFLLTLPMAEGNFPREEIWLLAHLALIVTVVGHFLWVQGATELPIALTGVLAYLQLPSSLFCAWLFVDEPLTAAMLVGAMLVIVGNLIAISDRRKQSAA
ncbi:MAG: DMT family transporter [Lacipirellulaceae bacterium]